MPGILSLMGDFFDDPRGMRLLSDTHGYTSTGLESSTSSQLHLHLPEVLAPVQYLIDAGLRPALARRLSSTYMDFVDRYRKTCQSQFDHATRGGHLTECYREVFTILFKRTTQVWDSKMVSIVRVQLCRASAPRVTVRPERVDASTIVISKAPRNAKSTITQIRVDDAAKAEIIARLRLKATHLASDRMVKRPSADVTSRLEEVSERTNASSTDTVDCQLMLPRSPPISSTSGRYDPFSRIAPQTCFPAPYPPPPVSCLPRNTLPTSFIPLTPPLDVWSSANHCPDISTLTSLFGRMTTTSLEIESRIPRSHGVFYIPDRNRVEPILSPSVADNSTKPQLTSVELIMSPTKPTNTSRRRKMASLPTRRGKTSASPSSPIFDSAGATSRPVTARITEQVVEITPPYYVSAQPQKSRPVLTPPSLYTAEVSCIATPKSSTARQRTVHTLHHKTLPQSQTFPQNQALRPPARARETFSYTISRSPSLVSDATSPPTSSDELDTPPSTPPRSCVLLARPSTEGLAISSESDGIVSHKEPLGDAKLPNPRQRYMRLDFTKGGLGRDEQPLTFTISV